MERAVFIALAGLILAGCLEDVDPISSTGSLSSAHLGTGSVILSWQPPTQNADGSPLRDLAGYNIYVGTGTGNYDVQEIRLDNPGLTTYVVENLRPGTYYFAATAVNSSGMESAFSGEVVRTPN